jgi:hypothetical protein
MQYGDKFLETTVGVADCHEAGWHAENVTASSRSPLRSR